MNLMIDSIYEMRQEFARYLEMMQNSSVVYKYWNVKYQSQLEYMWYGDKI